MTNTSERDNQLASMLADSFLVDLPDPALLVAFARDPRSLTPEQREEVESHLASSKGYAAQLRLLQRTDFEALERSAEPAPPTHTSRVPSATSPVQAPKRPGPRPGGRTAQVAAPRSRRGWVRAGWALALSGSAAALIPFLLDVFPFDGDGSDLGLGAGQAAAPELRAAVPTGDAGGIGGSSQSAKPRTSAGQAGSASRPSDPDAQTVEPAPTDPVVLAELDAPSPANEPASDSQAPSAPRREERELDRSPEPATSRAGSDLASGQIGAGQPAVQAVAEASSAERAVAADPSEPAVEEATSDAPIQLALVMPVYRAPADVETRARRTSTLRGAASLPQLRAMVPAHVGRTREASPSLFWYLDELPPKGARLAFAVTAPDAIEPLIETELPLPSSAGLQRIRLAEQGVVLEPDVEYRWSVALRSDPRDPTTETFVQAWVQRIAPGGQLTADLSEAAPGALPAALAGAGLWYDALAALGDLSERYPEDAELTRAQTALLEQVGLELP